MSKFLTLNEFLIESNRLDLLTEEQIMEGFMDFLKKSYNKLKTFAVKAATHLTSDTVEAIAYQIIVYLEHLRKSKIGHTPIEPIVDKLKDMLKHYSYSDYIELYNYVSDLIDMIMQSF